jgi:hypothetical protein
MVITCEVHVVWVPGVCSTMISWIYALSLLLLSLFSTSSVAHFALKIVVTTPSHI